MEFTGERYMPLIEKEGHPAIAFHNERYEFAALFCHRANVLEIGCGAGYGADILANRAWYVHATDYSEEAIAYCKEHYRRDNLEFAVRDITQWRPVRFAHDVIVAYEVIEHIKDGHVLMQVIKESIAPFGISFISTPAPPAHGSSWHKHEYGLEEFEGLLATHFKKYVILNHRPGVFSFNLLDTHTYIGIVWNGRL